MTFLWGFVLIRTADLAQTAVGTLTIRSATRPWLYVACLTAAVVESVVLGVLVLKQRSVLRSPRLVACDVAFALAALLTMPLYVAPGDRIGSWLAWAYPLTLSTAGLIGISTTGRAWRAVAGSVVLAATYIVVVAIPRLDHHGAEAASGFANACAYPTFALVVLVFASFVRRIADAADEARQRVQELERDRSRAVVHDMLSYLRLDRLLGATPQAQALLVEQALTKHRQMRAFVDGTDRPGDVESSLRSVIDLYPTLEPRLIVNLDDPTLVQDDVAVSLRQAVDTTLANVQNNAPAAQVVLTAESDGDQVVITIIDDGPGFDATTTKPGFGLRETLGRQLDSVGGAGRVTSRPGAGTQVEITVPRESE